jgi:hypothetical protein
MSEENEEERVTEEQRLQRRMDEENIGLNVVMKGDGTNFPVSILLVETQPSTHNKQCRYCNSCLIVHRWLETSFVFATTV